MLFLDEVLVGDKSCVDADDGFKSGATDNAEVCCNGRSVAWSGTAREGSEVFVNVVVVVVVEDCSVTGEGQRFFKTGIG